MPIPTSPVLPVRRALALAGMSALLLAALLPTVAAAANGSSGLAMPGPKVTLYAGTSPTFRRPAQVPPQALHANNANQRLTATSTISVTYHNFSQKAKAAFQAAVNVWQSVVVSTQVIHVDAHWTNLGSTSGILGQAGPTSEDSGGDGFWYPAALAEARCSCELNSGDPEISADFNSAFNGWYLGTDGNGPFSDYDFETVVLHELGHGLGFYSSFSYSGGNGSRHTSRVLRFDANEWDSKTGGNHLTSYASGSAALGFQLTNNSVYLGGAHVEAVLGERAKLYAPTTWSGGSSNSHLDEDKYAPGTINALMTPILNNGEAIHDPGPATKAIFQDIGWAIAGGSGDTTAPTVAKPKVNILASQTMNSKLSVRVSWPAATDASGIDSYELQRQDGAGPWVGVTLATPTSRSAEVAVTRGSNTAFRVRATDGADNVGDWTATPTASMATVQETSADIGYTGSWSRSAVSGSAGGKVEQSASTGSAAWFTFTGTSVALVSTLSPARGTAEIFVDNVSVGTVDLFSAIKKAKRVVWATEFAGTPGEHTVTVQVTGATSGSSTRIDIDAFLVWP